MKNQLIHYIDAGFPIVYINTFEEIKTDKIISNIADKTYRKVYEWDNSTGFMKWNKVNDEIKKQSILEEGRCLETTLSLLKYDEELNQSILVIKDGHHFLDDPKVISLLKDISHKILLGLEATVFIVSPKVKIPCEIDKYTTVLELGYLNEEEIESIIDEFIEVYEISNISGVLKNEMKSAFKGLSEYEIKNILSLSYAKDGGFTKSDLKLVHDQKKQIIKKSNILEMIELKESLEDIGGLESLKKWVKKKSVVFNNLEKEFKLIVILLFDRK